MTNTLYYGDNLPILREYIKDESVDLVYLDPPFNSNRSYSVLFKDESGHESAAQIEAFDDTWHWNEQTQAVYKYLVTDIDGQVGAMIGALRQVIGANQMMAYLVMMAVRLVELHRVLKPTGSLYLHCDPTASHYLKIMLDTIFGAQGFQNEIVWKRNFTKKGSQYDMTRFANNADILLFYTKGEKYTFRTPKIKLIGDEIASKYNLVDESGKHFKSEPLELPRMMARPNLVFEFMGYTPTYGWMMVREKLEQLKEEHKIYFTKNGKPRRKNYLDDYEGTEIDNIWIDISPLGQKQSEAMGYPTQKPLALLERIITASSNPGDVVLDPFCGCGTAVAAAQKLGRQWIGIDITHLAIALNKYRLENMFPGITMKIVGEPADVAAARQLAHDDRYQFQWWALSLIHARPLGSSAGSKTGKKGADQGVDGIINFIDDASEKPKQVMVQVKSGHVKAGDVRDLIGTVQNKGAQIGVFITLEDATQPMKVAAAEAGVYHSDWWNEDYPALQILTIEELMNGAKVRMPPAAGTFKKAPKVKGVSEAGQQGLFGDEHAHD